MIEIPKQHLSFGFFLLTALLGGGGGGVWAITKTNEPVENAQIAIKVGEVVQSKLDNSLGAILMKLGSIQQRVKDLEDEVDDLDDGLDDIPMCRMRR